MVTIKKRSNVIPVNFGEFELEYRGNDKNLKYLQQIGKNLQKRGDELSKTKDKDAFDQLYKVTKETWVELFDEAAFEKVYAFSDETIADTLFYLIETVKGIIDEIQHRMSKETLSKYLDD